MTRIEKKNPCDGCPGDDLAGTCASIKELGRCGQELRRKALAEYESLPKIHGWVARNPSKVTDFNGEQYEDGTIGIYPSKPKGRVMDICWERGEDDHPPFILPKEMFPEITWESEPVEVELLIRKITK